MAKLLTHPVRDSANLLVGFVVTVALLAAFWLSQAFAHTTLPNEHLWRSLAAQHAGGLTPGAAKAIKLVAQAPTAPAIVAPAPPPQTFQQLTPQQAAAANAKVAFSSLPNPAAAAFKLDAVNDDDRGRALDCLTMAVYYEAASESDEGQAAVAQVVLNRLRHPLFPKTVCGVVLQGQQLSTGCQFTFTCDGSLARRPTEAGWQRARRVAERALNGYVLKSVGEATHYHTVWVVPYWQPTVVKLTQIGAHIFYRWSGGMGRPVAFDGRYAGLEQAPPQIAGFTDLAPVAAPVHLVTAAVAPTVAPVLAAQPAMPTQLAALSAPHDDLSALQTAPQPQAYFGRPTTPGQRLAVSNGW